MKKFITLVAAFALVACGKDSNGGGGEDPIDPSVVYKTSGDLFGKNYVAKGTVFTRRVDKEMPLAPNSAAIAKKMRSLATNPYGVITTITRQHYNYTIIIVDSNDKKILPAKVDKEEGRVTFHFDTYGIKAYVSDTAGNQGEVAFNNSEINQTKLVSAEGTEVNDIPVDERQNNENDISDDTTFDVGNLNEKPPKKNDDYLYEKH